MTDVTPNSFQQILNHLATAVLTLDDSLRVRYMNSAAEELFALSARQACGHSLSRLVLKSDELEAIARRVLDRHTSLTGRDLELVPREAQAFPLAVDCSASIYEPCPDEIGVLLEFQDTTRLRRINRETELILQHGASRKIIRQLSHEIKNPLAGLKGAAQLLQSELSASNLVEYTEVMVREVDRLAKLIDRMLGPTGPPDFQPCNVHELLDHVLQLVASEAPPGVHSLRDFDLSLPSLSLDRALMTQVFLNLARNALQAMGEQGELVLRTRVHSNVTIANQRYRQAAVIEVQDNGPGVDSAVLDTLFYPLVTSRRDGTGLGLAISQDLVNRHAGLIEFSSRPGHTVFQVLLPMSTVADDDKLDE
ncbi:MAG: nitrogen regulation protein NR(II) [Gammaproteobacteria bacterium]|nr:nitrogen regulation protein NR(II) [Gammaproteobacteria bacterium]